MRREVTVAPLYQSAVTVNSVHELKLKTRFLFFFISETKRTDKKCWDRAVGVRIVDVLWNLVWRAKRRRGRMKGRNRLAGNGSEVGCEHNK